MNYNDDLLSTTGDALSDMRVLIEGGTVPNHQRRYDTDERQRGGEVTPTLIHERPFIRGGVFLLPAAPYVCPTCRIHCRSRGSARLDSEAPTTQKSRPFRKRQLPSLSRGRSGS